MKVYYHIIDEHGSTQVLYGHSTHIYYLEEHFEIINHLLIQYNID